MPSQPVAVSSAKVSDTTRRSQPLHHGGIFERAADSNMAVNAVLTQIATAMTVGGPEVKCLKGQDAVPCTSTADPRKDVAFCVRGCVIVSHSTGMLVTDVAMAMTQDPAFIARFGDVRFIPDHIKVHIAAAGADGGSQWASTILARTKCSGKPDVRCGDLHASQCGVGPGQESEDWVASSTTGCWTPYSLI